MVLIYGIPPVFRGGVFRLINNANLARGHARKGTEETGHIMVCGHTYTYIHTPDLAKAEGSSIVDEPGEGGTPVHQRREPEGF